MVENELLKKINLYDSLLVNEQPKPSTPSVDDNGNIEVEIGGGGSISGSIEGNGGSVDVNITPGNGRDGTSAFAKVEETENSIVITCTDANGVTTATIEKVTWS